MQTDALLESFLSLESSIDANPAGALPTQIRNAKSATVYRSPWATTPICD